MNISGDPSPSHRVNHMSDRILWFECYSGISGDMAVAAMLDLGADRDLVMKAVDSLGLDADVVIGKVVKSGVEALDFDVRLHEDNHDHDMEYLYGNRRPSEHHAPHGHRNLDDITKIVSRCDCSDKAKDLALRIFDILAEAEAKAHGVTKDKVHFHEVGAVDSIIDIVSLAVCVDNIGIDDIRFSELYEGTGCIRCQHGMLPIPVPAVANIVRVHNLRLRITDSEGEYVTPTGAAFVAAVGNQAPLPREFRIGSIGMGAGKRESERSGILRAMIVEPASDETHAVKLESNIDDCSGETLGYTSERLFDAGARDVFFSPIYMKKNRPAYMLTVICRDSDVEEMEKIIFSETTTIGIRRSHVEREVMDRRIDEVDTPLGRMDVKVCSYGGIARTYPEYDSLSRLCKEKGISYREGYDIVMSSLNDGPSRH